MLDWVVTLLIIAIIAALLGFGGIASTAVNLAQIIFVIALIFFLIAIIAGVTRSAAR
jgi:uncharacterized membrane protein YtjA (UPF0391 family)